MYYELLRDISVIKEIKSVIEAKSSPVNFKPLQGIVERKGVDFILLNESTANQVVEKYGKAYDLYDVNGASLEMRYFMSDFSCFFHPEGELKIFAVRLWKKHEAFQKHKKGFTSDTEITLEDVFNYYRTDVEMVKCYDETYYVDFGFYRYHFCPPDYEGQDESTLLIDSITIIHQKY